MPARWPISYGASGAATAIGPHFLNSVAIQLNDTHPTMAVPELMRILLDEAHLGWDKAWDLTQRTLAYTNHTLLPEALEKWPLEWFEALLPRHLEIIYEINRRLLDSVRTRFPGDEGRVQRVSVIEEGPAKHVRMANLAIVGSHSTNGVAAIHSELLRTTTVKDLAEMFPERFSNKTNGVTPRRWLLLANPAAGSHDHARPSATVGSLTSAQLSKLKPLADDKGFRDSFRKAKREAKSQFADLAQIDIRPDGGPGHAFLIARSSASTNTSGNCSMRCASWCSTTGCGRIRNAEMAPRTFFFAGKAAPAYQLAKLIIKFIENLAGTIDGDPAMRGRLKVLFLPEYDVSLAERLIPASDVSNQISTAGYEASGTSNMKFMMNGALTIGTRDGATIEMAQEAGEENFFLFGLTAEQVAGSRGWYNPHWHYEHEPETRAALDLIFSDHFSRNEPGVFAPLHDTLLTHGDHYMHLADLKSYLEADQRLRELYADSDAWARKAILNVAGSGKFSSDRTIAEYATRDLGGEAMPSAVETHPVAEPLAAGWPTCPKGDVGRRGPARTRVFRAPAGPRATPTRWSASEPADTEARRCAAPSPKRTSWPSRKPSATTGAATALTARSTWAKTRTRCPARPSAPRSRSWRPTTWRPSSNETTA